MLNLTASHYSRAEQVRGWAGSICCFDVQEPESFFLLWWGGKTFSLHKHRQRGPDTAGGRRILQASLHAKYLLIFMGYKSWKKDWRSKFQSSKRLYSFKGWREALRVGVISAATGQLWQTVQAQLRAAEHPRSCFEQLGSIWLTDIHHLLMSRATEHFFLLHLTGFSYKRRNT